MGFKIVGDSLLSYEDEPGVTQAVIPDGVRAIAKNAFKHSNITSVVIPDSVEYIANNAFRYCDGLVKVVLPKKNITIEKDAFFACVFFTANLSIREWDPLFGVSKDVYAKSYMNNYDPGDPHYELYHEENSHYIRLHLYSIIKTLENSDVNAVTYLVRERMLSLYRTNLLLDLMRGNIEGTALLLNYKHDAFPEEYLERYERENTEKELGLRERSLADWRRIFKLVSDGSGGWGIAEYRGTDAIIEIPEKINNKPVTRIMTGAFASTDQRRIIKEVILPDTITVIKDSAFQYCRSLQSITLSKNLERIGKYAFCRTGLTSIAIPDSVTHIERHTFEDCFFLEKVVLPDNLKKIGQDAFQNCGSLTAITLPETLIEIDKGAFYDCRSLTEIVIPSHITKITHSMFYYCESLKKVTLPDSLESIDEYAFCECKSLTSINIPNGVTEIMEGAFNNCSSLTTVKIPDSVLTLGNSVFQGCTQLADITISNSLESIEEHTFDECKSLTFIDITDGVTEIMDSAFHNCSSLTSVKMPDSVLTLGNCVFEGCTKLADITFSKDLEVYGYCCFDDTAWLKNQTDDFVIIADDILFKYNGSDSEVTIPAGVVIIGAYSFEGNEKITRVTIPEGVVSILDQAFANCSDLTHVTLPQSLKIIEKFAFLKTALCEITLPDGLMGIYYGAFGHCDLRSVTIPQSVYGIGGYAFAECAQLTEVNLPEKPPVILAGAFDGTPYYDDLPGDFIIFGDILHKYRGKSKKVIVPDNVRVIGDRAFRNNPYVTEIVVPDGVTEIEEEAFDNCEKLESIILPDTLTYLCDFDLNEQNYNVDLKVRYKGKIYGFEDYKLCSLPDLINSEQSK